MINTIEKLIAHADKADCFVVMLGEEAAVGLRHYSDDGIRVVRCKPDPRDYRPIQAWLAMSLAEVRAMAY